MNRNMLYLIVGALLVAVVVIGWRLYEEENKAGIDIEVGKGGVSVETN